MDSSASKPEAPNPNWAAATEQSTAKDKRREPWKEGTDEGQKMAKMRARLSTSRLGMKATNNLNVTMTNTVPRLFSVDELPQLQSTLSARRQDSHSQ